MTEKVNKSGIDQRTSSSSHSNWPDLAGKLIDRKHILPIRVYYEDTDFSGLVYHASYLRWIERARTDFVRLIGLHQKDMFEGQNGDDQLFFVVRRMELDYLKPARMDDVLEVFTQSVDVGAATVNLNQEVRRGDQVLFRAKVMIVLIDGAGKPARIREAMKTAFFPK